MMRNTLYKVCFAPFYTDLVDVRFSAPTKQPWFSMFCFPIAFDLVAFHFILQRAPFPRQRD
jgi:hypothetical protein